MTNDFMLATMYLNAMCTTLLMYYSNQMGLEFFFFFTAQAALTRVSSHVIVVFESKSQAVMKRSFAYGILSSFSQNSFADKHPTTS